MKRLSTAVAVIALIGTPAFAADMAVKAPPPAPAPVYSWTGWYVGGNVGYGWQGNSNASFSLINSTTSLASVLGPGPPVSFNISGPLGGLQIGYNWQVNKTWLLGFETDFDFSDISGSGTSTYSITAGPPGSTRPFATSADERVEWFGTVRGRLGYLPANNFLIYGTGGFAYGRVKQSASLINLSGTSFGVGQTDNCPGGPIACFAGTSTRTATGWTAGGGLEYAFWNNWTLRAEYLFVNLGSNTFHENDLSGGGPPIVASFNVTTFNIVRVGLNYQFH